MTDQVSTQRPSAVPYLLGGAAVGGAAGYFQDNLTGWNGVPKAKYNSMEDIVKEKKDTFTKADIATDLKDSAQKLENARNEYIKHVKENPAVWEDKVKTEGEALSKAHADHKTAVNKALESIKTKIKAGEIEGLDKALEGNKLDDAARKHLKANLEKEEYKAVKDAKTAIETARNALTQKAAAEKVSAHKVIPGLKDKSANLFRDVEKDAAKFKTANKLLNAAIGAVVLGLGALLLRPSSKEQ